MKMFVGLGNPGLKYKKTRHNTGFMFVDEVCLKLNSSFILEKKFKAEIATAMIGNEKIIFVKPVTYMNLSGEAVRLIKDFYEIDPEDIYVIHDDMDLPVSKLRLKKNGSSAGHNGIKSIIENLKTENFNRIRIGVGSSKDHNMEVVDYVLGKFDKNEAIDISITISKALDIVEMIVKSGFETAMNSYN